MWAGTKQKPLRLTLTMSIMESIRGCAEKVLEALLCNIMPSTKEPRDDLEYLKYASVMIATKFILAVHSSIEEEFLRGAFGRVSTMDILFDKLENLRKIKDPPIEYIEAAVFDYFDFKYICNNMSSDQETVIPVDKKNFRVFQETLELLAHELKVYKRCKRKRSSRVKLARSYPLDKRSKNHFAIESSYEYAATKKRYMPGQVLGQGTFGLVKLVTDSKDMKVYAMKKIVTDPEFNHGLGEDEIREICILREYADPHIVPFVDVLYFPPNLYIVMPLMIDLYKYMREVNKGSDAARKSYNLPFLFSVTKQFMQVLSFFKEKHIIHRDIKPQNILVDKEQGLIKMSDFGLARYARARPMKGVAPMTHEVVTLWYRAPEILLGNDSYNAAIDMWSIACVLVELASDKSWFPADSEIEELFKIFSTLGSPRTDDPQSSSLTKFKDYTPITFPNFKRKDPIFQFHSESTLTDDQKVEFRGLIDAMVVLTPSLRITPETALRVEFVKHAPDTFR